MAAVVISGLSSISNLITLCTSSQRGDVPSSARDCDIPSDVHSSSKSTLCSRPRWLQVIVPKHQLTVQKRDHAQDRTAHYMERTGESNSTRPVETIQRVVHGFFSAATVDDPPSSGPSSAFVLRARAREASYRAHIV